MRYNSKRKFFYQNEKFKLFALMFLSLASLSLFAIEQRYEVFQEKLLPNLDFREVGKYWIGSRAGVYVIPGRPTTLVLNYDGQRQTLVTQTLRKPHRFENVRIAVDVKFDAVEAGPAWWHKAGVLALSYDQQGKRMTYWPSEIAFQSGTHDWRRYTAVIPTSKSMKTMQIFILHGGKSGALRIRNLQIDAAWETEWFVVAKHALLASWVAAALWILLPLIIQHRRNILAYLSLACFLGMLSVSVLPQPLLSTSSKPALDKLASLTTPAEAPPETSEKAPAKKESPSPKDATATEEETKPQDEETSVATKTVRAKKPLLQVKGDPAQYAAHFLSHVFLALLVGLAFRRAAWWRLALYLLLAATTNELLQIFVVTRSAGVLDGVANAAGAAVGLLILYGFLRIWRRVAA